jgi:ribosomal 30S subunit maturation factor RimM
MDLGTVSHLIDTGPHCVLRDPARRRAGAEAEVLVPFVAPTSTASTFRRAASRRLGPDY